MRRAPKAEHLGRVIRRRTHLEERARASGRDEFPIEVWASRDWFVQVYDQDGVERISVNRTTMTPRGDRWRDGITWDELQAIKAAIGRGDRWALEVYPPDDHVIDLSNMRHLFLVVEKPSFAWGKDGRT